MNFGEKIKEKRQLHHLSQRQLAEKINVSPRTIRSWEQEGRVPKQEWIYSSLATLFVCPMEYFNNKPSASTTNTSIPADSAAEAQPLQLLDATKALLAEHQLPIQEEFKFILELMQISLASLEEKA